MKRVVICVPDPWNYIPLYEKEYSIMVLNPSATPARNQYLLDNSDYSLYVTSDSEQERNGKDYLDERAFWYTSGTTGDSKFCSFSYSQMEHVCRHTIKSYDITANDRYTSIMGLWHAHGQLFYWLTKMVDLEVNFLPVTKLLNLHKHSPTFITAIPDMLNTVMLMGQKFPELRFIRSASTALYNPLYQNLKDAFNVPVIEAFGMTESCSHCFTNPLYGEQRMGTIGLVDGIEARIDGERLLIQGPAVHQPGWFDTGDLADVDDDGYYRILGRAKDRINVRGYKLDPSSLEQQLASALPGIIECAVFGKDSVRCIFTGDCTIDQVTDVLKSLGSQCRPTFVEQLKTIPKNAAGKVSRTMLNDLF